MIMITTGLVSLDVAVAEAEETANQRTASIRGGYYAQYFSISSLLGGRAQSVWPP